MLGSSALSPLYLGRLLGLFAVGLGGGLVAFSLTYIRPFFGGFDLNTIAREDGVRAAEFFTDDGERLQHRLSGVTAYFFDGTHAGGQADLAVLEQAIGRADPDLQGLNIAGNGPLPNGLILDTLRAQDNGQGYEASQGITGSYAGNGIEAEAAAFDPETGILTTRGATRIRNGGFEIKTDEGAQITRTGDIRIGGDGQVGENGGSN